MKQSAPYSSPHRIARVDVQNRTMLFYIGISAVCHIVMMAAFILMPALITPKRYIPSVVNVSLVSLPAPGGDSGTKATVVEKPAVETTAPPKPVPQPEPVKPAPQKPAETISIAPAQKTEKKVKESLKHKTFNPEKVIKESVSKLEKEVEETRHPSLEEALSRLKRQVEKEENRPQTAAGRGAGETGTGADRQTGSGMTSSAVRDRVRIYQAEIAYQVQKNWAYAGQLAGGRTDLEAALGIKIMPNGEISDIWFDQRSGNKHLDESAYRAIVKSNPLPPLPEGLFGTHYIVGLRFGPKGIK